MSSSVQSVHTLSNELLLNARRISRTYNCSIINALEELTGLEPRELIQSVAETFSYKVLEIQEMLAMSPAFDVVGLALSIKKQCVVLRDGNQQLLVVLSDPFDINILPWLSTKIECPFSCALALRGELLAYLSKQEESVRAVDQIITEESKEISIPQNSAPILSFSSVSADSSPAVKLVNSTLYDALKAGASDVHIESSSDGLTVRYRIDGVLDLVTNASGSEISEQVISRIKVLAELDIAERRVPQDGSFRVRIDERDIDLRVSVMPSIHGEDAVIRILDKRKIIAEYGALSLESLGFDNESLSQLRILSEEAYGMLLVTGPTGSGKTTTLYATLTEINTGGEKIITIEDPVEYQLPGILQIPVNEKKGLSFSKGLRSILRHDPDKIMVGEIRDKDTAEIAVQSALTGHLVLTTVHANNVFDVFGRFSHMGIDPYSFLSALNGIWAQRLVRLNCTHCSRPISPDNLELWKFNLTHEQIKHYQFRRGDGCGECRGTGYKGRRAIAEILSLNDELREMIVEKKPIRQIKEYASKNGTRSLRQTALNLVRDGFTTLDEIKRVTLHA